MVFFNSTDTIGVILTKATENNTGNLFITVLIVFVILFAVLLMLRVSLEISALLLLPLLITCMAFMGEFVIIGIAVIFLLGIIFTKMFLVR